MDNGGSIGSGGSGGFSGGDFGASDTSFEGSGGSFSPQGPVSSGSSSFDTTDSIEPVVDNSPKMTWLDYLKDGVDKGYYKAENQGVFSMEEVMSDAQDKMKGFDQEIMEIPGTAHDKLEALAAFDSQESFENEGKDNNKKAFKEDEEADHKEEKGANGNDSREKYHYDSNYEFGGGKKEPSIEEKIMFAQAEALRFLAMANSEKGNKSKDKEKLIEELKKLLKEAEESKNPKKANLIDLILNIAIALFSAGEKGVNQLEKEVKSAQS